MSRSAVHRCSSWLSSRPSCCSSRASTRARSPSQINHGRRLQLPAQQPAPDHQGPDVEPAGSAGVAAVAPTSTSRPAWPPFATCAADAGARWTRACSATTTRSCATCARWVASSRASSRRSPAASAWKGMEVSDPYVERLIEGCAFLAARVQLKQDAEFPELAQRLLEMISPEPAAPMPSMLVARIQCANDPNLVNGFTHAARQRAAGRRDRAQPHALRVPHRPGRRADADPGRERRVLPQRADLPPVDAAACRSGRAAACASSSSCRAGLSFNQLKLGALRFYIGGLPDVALRLHELMVGAASACSPATAGRGADAEPAVPRRRRACAPPGFATTRRCCR